MVASSFAGRVRIRDRQLADPEVLHAVGAALEARAGILEVSGNPRVGSVLICYDEEAMGLDDVLEAVGAFFSPPGPGEAAPRGGRGRGGWVKVGMLGSLGLSLAGAALGAKKLHVIAGLVFLATVAAHVIDKEAAKSRYRRRSSHGAG